MALNPTAPAAPSLSHVTPPLEVNAPQLGAASTLRLAESAGAEAGGPIDEATRWNAREVARRDPTASQLRSRAERALLTPKVYRGQPEDFIPKDAKVAIIQGPEMRAMEGTTGGLISGTALRASRQYPNSTIIPHDQLGPGSLAGYDAAIVVTHGAPNQSMWGGDRIGTPGAADYREMPGYQVIDGATLGRTLEAAGFDGKKIFLDSCNAGTESAVGGLGTSTAQAVARATGATVLAARARDDKVPEALNHGLDGIAGTVFQTGDLDSDLNTGRERLKVTVPDGNWALFSSSR